MLAPLFIAVLLAQGAAPPQQKDLAIVDPALREYEDGPVLASNFSFVTGEMVFLSFRIDGYKVADSQVAVRAEVDAVDPEGVKLVETLQREIKTSVSTQDKDWAPVVRHSFLIPPLALPGTYRVLVTVNDELAGKQVKKAIDFKVRGHDVQPSDKLVARNFRFLKSEDGQQQLIEPVVYQPGGMLWARFDMTGFRYAENNRVSVEYGFSVLGADGKELYSQPSAATGEGESFYPRKYMEGILSLDLKTARPGDYTIVLKIRDTVGNQTDESRHPFSIRP